MAKKNKNKTAQVTEGSTTPAAKGAADQRFNSAGKKRTTADLAKSDKGNIIRVIRSSASLANANDRKGLEKELGEKGNSAKNLAGRLNATVKENGKIDKMDDSTALYATTLSKAGAALGSLQAGKYDANVVGFLQHILTALPGAGGGGGRKGFNPNSVSDIVFGAAPVKAKGK